MDYGEKILTELLEKVKNMSNEEYNKLYDDANKTFISWGDSQDDNDTYVEEERVESFIKSVIGDQTIITYEQPGFPYFSFDIVKRKGKFKFFSVGIFKDTLYINLDLS